MQIQSLPEHRLILFGYHMVGSKSAATTPELVAVEILIRVDVDSGLGFDNGLLCRRILGLETRVMFHDV